MDSFSGMGHRDTEGHDTLQELVNTDSLSFHRYDPLIREGKQLTLVRGFS